MVRFLGLSKPTWIIIFIVIQILPFSLIISGLASENFFSQTWTFKYSSDEKFKGKILGPNKDLRICDESDSYQHCYDKCDNYCSRFWHWYYSGAVFVTLETSSLVILFLAQVFLVLELCKFRYLRGFVNSFTTAFMQVLVFLFHFLGVVIWAGVNEVSFGDCSHEFSYKGSKSVCAEDGFKIALACLIITGVIAPGYFLVFFKLWRKESNQYEHQEDIPLT